MKKLWTITVWIIVALATVGLIYYKKPTKVDVPAPAVDSVQVKNVIMISTFEELCRIGKDSGYPLDGHYELANDIDASESRNMREGFEPIAFGTDTSPYWHRNGFRGEFNGNGHTIKNLFVNRPWNNYVGLFSSLGRRAEIRDLDIEADSVIGYGCVGGLAGLVGPSVHVSNVRFSGNVHGADYVNELVGCHRRRRGFDCSTCSFNGHVIMKSDSMLNADVFLALNHKAKDSILELLSEEQRVGLIVLISEQYSHDIRAMRRALIECEYREK